MGVSWKLATNYLRSNKKKTIVLIICILISTMLITTILLLMDSYKMYLITDERNRANWEVAYSKIAYKDAKTIEKHRNVREMSVMHNIDAEYLKDNMKNSVELIECDTSALNNFIKPLIVEGRIPQNNSEILVPDYIEEAKIGDDWKFSNIDKTYKIVGKFEQVSILSTYSDYFVTFLDRKTLQDSDIVSVSTLSKNIKEVYNDYYDIYHALKVNNEDVSDKVMYNSAILELANVYNYDENLTLDKIKDVLIIIVMICMALFIYSLINIGIIERKKYFGILKSIGATTKQMRYSVRIELLIILLIAIPLGILLGIALTFIVISVINAVQTTVISANSLIPKVFLETGEDINLAIPISSVELSILLVIFVTYISAVMPIKKVGRLDAIELIKQNKVKIRNKKYDMRIENKLALSNIEKYKPRYSAIIISLTLSIILIISVSYFMENTFKNTITSKYNYYIDLGYDETKTPNLEEDIIKDIKETFGIKEIVGRVFLGTNLLINENEISEEEKQFSKYLYNGEYSEYVHLSRAYSKNKKIYFSGIYIVSLDTATYNEVLKEAEVDYLDTSECILFDTFYEKTKYYDKIKITNFKEGDTLKIRNALPNQYDCKEDFTLKIKKVSDKCLDVLQQNIGERQLPKNHIIIIKGQDNKTFDGYSCIELKAQNVEMINNYIPVLEKKYDLGQYGYIRGQSQYWDFKWETFFNKLICIYFYRNYNISCSC